MEAVTVQQLEDKGLQGLTSAQQAFARHVHSGLTYTEAYRLAFPGYKGAGLEQAAHALAKNVKVELKLRELRLSAEQQTSLAPGITREWVLKGFKEIAEDPTVKPSTRLAAYIAAGKTYAAPVFRNLNNRTPSRSAPRTWTSASSSYCAPAWRRSTAWPLTLLPPHLPALHHASASLRADRCSLLRLV